MTSYYESIVFTKRSFLSVIRGYEVSSSVYLNFIKKNSAFVLKRAELSDLKLKKKTKLPRFQNDCHLAVGGGICSASSFRDNRRFIESAYFPDFSESSATNVFTDLKIAAGLRFEKYLSY